MIVKTRAKLVYPPELVDEPIIWSLSREFNFIVNIRKAEVKPGSAWLEVDMEGEREEIIRGIDWLKARGIEVMILEEATR